MQDNAVTVHDHGIVTPEVETVESFVRSIEMELDSVHRTINTLRDTLDGAEDGPELAEAVPGPGSIRDNLRRLDSSAASLRRKAEHILRMVTDRDS